MYNELINTRKCRELKGVRYIELIRKLTHEELKYFMTFEFSNIVPETVTRFIVNSDIKDFLIEYLWEVNAADPFIKMTEDLPISHEHMFSAYKLLDHDCLYYIVLPSGAVVSWV